MTLDAPQVQRGLSLGLNFGMLWQTQWKACSSLRLWPFQQPAPQCSPHVSSASQPKKQAAPCRPARIALPGGAKPTLFPVAALGLAACGTLSVACGGGSLLLRGLAAYATAELGFQAYQCWRYTECNALVEALPSPDGIPQTKARFLRLAGVLDIRAFLSQWFHGAPFEDIKRGNVQDFIAYGFYCTKFEQLQPEQQAATLDFIARVEAAWDVRFSEGYNADIAPMQHLWEPLRVMPKPLIVHLFSELGGIVTRIMLRRRGYERSSYGGFRFWVRRAPAPTPAAHHRSVHSRGDSAGGEAAVEAGAETGSSNEVAPKPLVFLHGVGFGLLPYLNLVRMLSEAAPAHPVVLAEVPHVSLRLCRRAVTVDTLAHAVAGALEQNGFSGACFVGHSYGTFAVSRLRQLYPEMVESMAILDPVCLMTCDPHLLSNFIYRPPSLRPTLGGFFDAARFLVSRDLMIASAFCRSFYWHELMLWPDDMPEGATVVALSARDDLVPVPLVQAQLEAAGSSAKVLLHPTAKHGAFLVDRPFQELIVAEVQRLLLQTDDKL